MSISLIMHALETTCFGSNDIDKRLTDRDLLHAGHIESVHVFPPVDLLVLVLAVLDGADVESSAIGENESGWRQPLIPGIQDGFEHGLVEEAISHPLGHDDVDLLNTVRERYLLHFALDDVTSMIDNVGTLDTDHLLSTSLGGEHAEDASSTSDVEHDFIFEEMFVVIH